MQTKIQRSQLEILFIRVKMHMELINEYITEVELGLYNYDYDETEFSQIKSAIESIACAFQSLSEIEVIDKFGNDYY